ncbi:MAG TPA: endonuclease/exonuclease/phosphatase family protein, partial [Ignavibacteriaceae bacterium]|nr:endonuclease/exonuclease/phosphatase family protein [Ignavibacteriaceae bacterium]
INSYLTGNSGLKIIILGDFNDEPDDASIKNILNANPLLCGSYNEFKRQDLYNLSYFKFRNGEGTYKYKDEWNMLDQIIVSGSLVNESGIEILCGTFEIYKPYFLQSHSGKYEGTPFPTYGGSRYLGGCSDHYPVTAQIILKED